MRSKFQKLLIYGGVIMFRAEKSWEVLARSFSAHLEPTRYQVIEVEEDDTVFSLEIWSKSRQETTRKKYLSTSLAYAKDFLLASCDQKVQIHVLVSEQECGQQTLSRVCRIIGINDDEEFQNLYYQCENGKVYLDGVGAVVDVDLRTAEILWEQLA